MNLYNLPTKQEVTPAINRQMEFTFDIDRGLMNTPVIVFGDEPCANLDTESSRMVFELFKRLDEELNQTGVIVLLEHWHERFFDRVIRFREGKVEW